MHCFNLVLALVLMPIAQPAGAAKPAAGPKPEVARGQLILEGMEVERLTLEKMGGEPKSGPNEVVFERPGKTVSLPAGRYAVRKIELVGGYFAQVFPAVSSPGGAPEEGELLNVEPGARCSLQVGGPLTPTLEVHQRDANLVLIYRLLDSQSRTYTRQPVGAAPRFTVYAGERVVGSGEFEYG